VQTKLGIGVPMGELEYECLDELIILSEEPLSDRTEALKAGKSVESTVTKKGPYTCRRSS
jgi:hypothetical protein